MDYQNQHNSNISKVFDNVMSDNITTNNDQKFATSLEVLRNQYNQNQQNNNEFQYNNNQQNHNETKDHQNQNETRVSKDHQNYSEDQNQQNQQNQQINKKINLNQNQRQPQITKVSRKNQICPISKVQQNNNLYINKIKPIMNQYLLFSNPENVLIGSILFIILSLPQINNITSKIVPNNISSNIYSNILIKSVIYIICFILISKYVKF